MIEFLYWQGCPSHERALSNLRDQMARHGIPESDLTVREVATESAANDERFVGSPTIRLDGVDIVDPGDEPIGLNCRIYYRRDGRPSPLPDTDDLKEAIENYARKSQ